MDQNVKSKFDFSVKVVDNALELYRVSKAIDTREAIEKQKVLISQLVHDAQKAMLGVAVYLRSISEVVSELDDDERYLKLRETLDRMENTSIEPWMVSREYPQGNSLVSFVDEQGISETHQEIETQKRDIADVATSLQTCIDSFEQRITVCVQARVAVTEVLPDQLQVLDDELKRQDSFLKTLSNGSFNLAAIYQLILNGPDSLLAENQNLETLQNKLQEFASNPLFEQPNQDSCLDQLLDRVEICFKIGLKAVFKSYNDLKAKLALEKMQTQLQTQVIEPLKILLKEIQESVSPNILSEINSTKLEIFKYFQEFEKLDQVYKEFLGSQILAKEEVFHRWNFLTRVEELAKKQQEELDKIMEIEKQRRSEFSSNYGMILPQGFCPAITLDTPPTTFHYVLVNPDEAQLLGECVENLNKP